MVFKPQYSKEQVLAFIDALRLFKIGYSWGGVTSLVMTYDLQSPKRPAYGSRLVRLTLDWKRLRILWPMWNRRWEDSPLSSTDKKKQDPRRHGGAEKSKILPRMNADKRGSDKAKPNHEK